MDLLIYRDLSIILGLVVLLIVAMVILRSTQG
jgi:hypothetical protein